MKHSKYKENAARIASACLLGLGLGLHCSPSAAGSIKPYIWAFSKPAETDYQMTVGAQLPVFGHPSFGTDLILPTALPHNVYLQARSYTPTGVFWSKLQFSRATGLPTLDKANFVMRYDPETIYASTDFTAEKQFQLQRYLGLTVQDTYSFNTTKFDTQEINWSTYKSLSFLVKPSKTRFTAALNAGTDDGWHSSLSLSQPIGKTVTVEASLIDPRSSDSSSVLKANFVRRW